MGVKGKGGTAQPRKPYKSHRCMRCGGTFVGSAGLAQHLRDAHGVGAGPAPKAVKPETGGRKNAAT